MNWIFSLFPTGFLLPVQPAKINFEIDFCRLKIQFVEIDFYNLIFQKSSADQQGLCWLEKHFWLNRCVGRYGYSGPQSKHTNFSNKMRLALYPRVRNATTQMTSVIITRRYSLAISSASTQELLQFLICLKGMSFRKLHAGILQLSSTTA